MRSERATGLLMATITALSWAVLAIGLKFALHYFSSGTIVWTRMVFAFLVLFVLFAWKRWEWLMILKRPPLLGLLAGALIACNYIGFMKGIELTSASNAQIMIQLAPLSFAVLSIILFKEIPTWRQTLGMLIALCGFGFFYWDQILMSVADVKRFQTGNLWILMAAGTWAVFALIQKRLLRNYKPQQFNILIYLVSAILLIPTADFSQLNLNPGLGPWLLIAALALNTVIAYGALSEALPRIPASQVSMIIAVNPLGTLLIMTVLTKLNVPWIGGEPIHWRGFLGAFLVVLGVICTVSAPVRRASAQV